MNKNIRDLLRQVKDKDRIDELGVYHPYMPLMISGKSGKDIWGLSEDEIQEFVDLLVKEIIRVLGLHASTIGTGNNFPPIQQHNLDMFRQGMFLLSL